MVGLIEQVMLMLKKIGSIANAKPWIEQATFREKKNYGIWASCL